MDIYAYIMLDELQQLLEGKQKPRGHPRQSNPKPVIQIVSKQGRRFMAALATLITLLTGQ
jgi:hypothetical protein